eukprot:Gb_14762 [translate_table: standard]
MSSDTEFSGPYENKNDNGSNYAIDGNIMMAAVIVLFVVILFVFLLHLYARRFWRQSVGLSRRRQRSWRRRRFSFAGGDPFRMRNVGLNKAVIEALPIFLFKSEDFKDGLDCAVCLCEFEENEKARLLPRCNHSFHTECIDMWFHSHSTCPLCRTSAQPGPPSNALVESGHTEQISSNNSSTEEPISSTEIHGSLICQHLEEGQASSGAVEQQNPGNGFIWSNQKEISMMEEGTSRRRSLPQIAIDIPRRPDSFLSPREDQVCSPNGQSSKSPVTRLLSLKRMLSRDKDRKVFPSNSDECDIEKDGTLQN